MDASPQKALIIAAALVLALLTLLTFSGVLDNGFVYDDEQYVTTNPQVRGGFSRAGLAWAWTSFDHSNWHPLTWISHQADVQLFGLDPRGHHLTSLLLHVANAVLLLLALARLTGSPGSAAAAALLFTVHPLRVESVAWVAERKDVLSLLCALLTLLAYERYVRRPGALRYSSVVVLLALGLMAKPMLVTLPLLLLLLDWWPLGRFGAGAAALQTTGRRTAALVVEKMPLLALAAASSLVTYVAQARSGALTSTHVYPLGQRFANAAESYLAYLSDTVWPVRLAVVYPIPAAAAPGRAALAAAALLIVSLLAVHLARKAPFFPMGWFWFTGALVPVIGLVQVGGQVRADRYTYLPSIGLVVAAVWGAERLARRRHGRRALLAVVAAALTLALIWASRAQVRQWQDNVTLFTRAAAASPDSWFAHANLGKYLLDRGQIRPALAHLRQAERINPGAAQIHLGLGAANMLLGHPEEAVSAFSKAVVMLPQSAGAHNNLGLALARLGRWPEAIEQYREVTRLNPAYPAIHLNLGKAFTALGAYGAAAASFRRALEQKPDEARARAGLEQALAGQSAVGTSAR